MSKQIRIFYLTFAASLFVLQFFTIAAAQDIHATIKIDKRLPGVVEIHGRFSDSSKLKKGRNISFPLSYAGIQDLGTRISDVRLLDASGGPVANRRMIDGEYLAEADYASWLYKVNVAPRTRASAFAHISWISEDVGVLMLRDLMPEFGDEKASARIEFAASPEYKVQTSETELSARSFATADIERAVFFIGPWRSVKVDGSPVSLAMAGERQFSDAEAAQMIREIFADYKSLFRREPDEKLLIAIGQIPDSTRPGQWYAETRGTTVTIMSSDMAFKTQTLQQLHEQLRHEMFHLWIPNGVNLKGNYDWFYEGFALYASLKAGVRFNRIRFDDFLDTLSRAHRFDDAILPTRSLVDASENRWGGGNDRVYARGMLVAFLADLSLLQRSKGKRSVEDLIVKLYDTYREAAAPEDANAAVLRVLRASRELVPIVDKYVTGKERIAWTDDLRFAGIDTTALGLKVVPKPNGSQKALLDKLGYNSWRKLSRNSK